VVETASLGTTDEVSEPRALARAEASPPNNFLGLIEVSVSVTGAMFKLLIKFLACLDKPRLKVNSELMSSVLILFQLIVSESFLEVEFPIYIL
jgi:hypothetical protein